MNAHNILFELRMSCISGSEDLTNRSRVCSISPYHFACVCSGSLSKALGGLHHRERISFLSFTVFPKQHFCNNTNIAHK